jgi:nucleoside 2-deoxyribosyltransferase
MKKAYLSISYRNRKKLSAEMEVIQTALALNQIELFVFIDNYQFAPSEEKQMMQQAFTDITSADLLIAEVSEKAIGVGIEIGYASALNKPIVYLRNTHSEHSTTASGCAAHSIIYQNPEDLAQKLKEMAATLQF